VSESFYFAPSALTPEGWVEGLRLGVTGGRVSSLAQASAPSQGDLRLAGPLLPGMPNGHSHSFQRAMAGRAEWRARGVELAESHFWSWREEMYRWALRLEPEALGALAALVALEGLKAGFTSVCEFHYLHHDPRGARYAQLDELSARVILGMRGVGVAVTQLPVLYQQAGFNQLPPLDEQRRFICSFEEYERLVSSLRARFAQDQGVVIGLAPHSLRAVSPAALSALSELSTRLAEGRGAPPVHIHIAEQQAEVEGALARLGARPVDWLLDQLELGGNWSLIHSTHVTERELERLAERGVVVGLCPTTEANLGDGIFPLRGYLDRGGLISVGSDSNVSASVAEELRLLEYGQRLQQQRRNVAALAVPSRGEGQLHVGAGLWGAAVRGGGRASARPCELRLGDWADWVVLDPDDEALWGLEGPQLVDAWVFASRRPQVRDAFVAGEQLLFEGRHPHEEQIKAEARRQLDP